jgi:CheY-like chemotaxis protein
LTAEHAATLESLRASERALRDTTEEVARLRSEATRAARLKEEFLASVSHELRTPLHAILGWVSILRHERRPIEMVDKGLAVIERNARAQQRVAEDLLDEASILSGSLRVVMEPVDLAAAVAAAVEPLELAAFARGVSLEVRIAADARCVVGGPTRVRQIVGNLVGNAIKFSAEGGAISVATHRRGASLVLEVRDTGEGMPQSFVPHAFDRFRQRHVAQSDRRGGVGLGLALVKQLVELHGGTVAATSDGEGCGSTFVVTLPAAPTQRRSQPTPVPGSGDRSPQGRLLLGRRILIVDDERDALELIELALGARGAQVVAASSACEALTALENGAFDVLISDIAMADVDGLELIHRGRGLPSPTCDMPAVALSAHTRPQDAQRSWAAGFDLHIAKPTDLPGLVVTLLGLLEGGRGSAHSPGFTG